MHIYIENISCLSKITSTQDSQKSYILYLFFKILRLIQIRNRNHHLNNMLLRLKIIIDLQILISAYFNLVFTFFYTILY